MIRWVHERCTEWAEWTRRRADHGLGYPRQCSYTRLDAAHRGQLFAGEYNERAHGIEDAVRRLLDLHRQVVRTNYLGKGMARQKARDVGVSVTTYYELLHGAHERIASQLQNDARQRYAGNLTVPKVDA